MWINFVLYDLFTQKDLFLKIIVWLFFFYICHQSRWMKLHENLSNKDIRYSIWSVFVTRGRFRLKIKFKNKFRLKSKCHVTAGVGMEVYASVTKWHMAGGGGGPGGKKCHVLFEWPLAHFIFLQEFFLINAHSFRLPW